MPKSYHMQVAKAAKQAHRVIQMHECCSGTASNNSDIGCKGSTENLFQNLCFTITLFPLPSRLFC